MRPEAPSQNSQSGSGQAATLVATPRKTVPRPHQCPGPTGREGHPDLLHFRQGCSRGAPVGAPGPRRWLRIRHQPHLVAPEVGTRGPAGGPRKSLELASLGYGGPPTPPWNVSQARGPTMAIGEEAQAAPIWVRWWHPAAGCPPVTGPARPSRRGLSHEELAQIQQPSAGRWPEEHLPVSLEAEQLCPAG